MSCTVLLILDRNKYSIQTYLKIPSFWNPCLPFLFFPSLSVPLLSTAGINEDTKPRRLLGISFKFEVFEENNRHSFLLFKFNHCSKYRNPSGMQTSLIRLIEHSISKILSCLARIGKNWYTRAKSHISRNQNSIHIPYYIQIIFPIIVHLESAIQSRLPTNYITKKQPYKVHQTVVASQDIHTKTKTLSFPLSTSFRSYKISYHRPFFPPIFSLKLLHLANILSSYTSILELIPYWTYLFIFFYHLFLRFSHSLFFSQAVFDKESILSLILRSSLIASIHLSIHSSIYWDQISSLIPIPSCSIPPFPSRPSLPFLPFIPSSKILNIKIPHTKSHTNIFLITNTRIHPII